MQSSQQHQNLTGFAVTTDWRTTLPFHHVGPLYTRARRRRQPRRHFASAAMPLAARVSMKQLPRPARPSPDGGDSSILSAGCAHTRPRRLDRTSPRGRAPGRLRCRAFIRRALPDRWRPDISCTAAFGCGQSHAGTCTSRSHQLTAACCCCRSKGED